MLKDPTIISIIEKIGSEFGSNVKVIDHWDADLCAIGFTDPNEKCLVYVSTYNKPDNLFFVSLEEIRETNNQIRQTLEEIEFDELKTLIKSHLIQEVL